MASPTAATEAASLPSSLTVRQLDTYFLFPFALDKEAIQTDHPDAWPRDTRWIDGLDRWISSEHPETEQRVTELLGQWKRATFTNFDLSSGAYADLLFFNSIVRHVFFDTSIGRRPDDQQNQLRCYSIEIPAGSRLWFEGNDTQGNQARICVSDLRLYLSAQGMGILSIGVSGSDLDPVTALWINRRLRKLYPVDAESVHEARTPAYIALRLERGSEAHVISEERFENPAMVGFYPPLPKPIESLLYFADYAAEEYEPICDENMFVYSWGEIEGAQSVEDDPITEEFLYLRHKHSDDQPYASLLSNIRFGFTAHSWSILDFSGPSSGEQPERLRSFDSARDFLKAFHSSYYLMVVIALFYRASLLDFSERSALVSRRLLRDQEGRRLTPVSIDMVNDLRTEFLNFSSYWHFDTLSSKQEGNDLFRRLCAEFRIDEMKNGLSSELRHMGEYVYNYYQLRNTDAVNRLSILSLIFGGGAVLTGFFGMNFGREFTRVFFEGEGGTSLIHYFMVFLVITFVFGSLMFGTFVVMRNWRDYLSILNPQKGPRSGVSLKRDLE